ncbi:hypothetical protein [Mesorhizobium sp. B2-8-9]|uniref:hypothetical protein n=1 Tax=Mesorhizobium sp. B2-8-9 TaxID=2589899 RepID=UPI00112EEBFB|nr:hypothetical protein [Mesorhizobium sp. B2-8-9]TPI86399.1 hypothetical protein FJ423_00830 [Mesorhizobium sp. B2-8-9]
MEHAVEVVCLSRSTTYNVKIVDPLMHLREPFTGDQEQMLADMRRVEPLRKDVFEGLTERLSAYWARKVQAQYESALTRALRGYA